MQGLLPGEAGPLPHPAVADVHVHRRSAAAAKALTFKLPLGRWRHLVLRLCRLPYLFLLDPPPRLIELLQLNPLQEAQQLQARRQAIVHRFDFSGLGAAITARGGCPVPSSHERATLKFER